MISTRSRRGMGMSLAVSSLTVLSLAALSPSALPAQAYSLGARSAADDLSLVAGRDAAFVETAAGRRLTVPLPPGATVHAFEATTNGWLAVAEVAGEAGRSTLRAWTGNLDAAADLALPGRQVGARRQGPVVLLAGGELRGLAWLEGDGDRALAVRAAAWDGRAWGEVERVSTVGPGTQTALSGAVLADGSWLLAWSAYDGTDTEVVWSRRTAEGWRKAARVSADNAVPDVVPALTADGRGALLAWSRYDGNDYRLRLARFEGGRWQGEAVVGPKGSVEPGFTRDGDRSYLLFLTAAPSGWGIYELGPGGQITRQAGLARKGDARPLVLGAEPDGKLRLRWPLSGREARLALEGVP